MVVSMPVSWEELKDVPRGDEWTMAHAVERQRTLKADPWDGYSDATARDWGQHCGLGWQSGYLIERMQSWRYCVDERSRRR
ncbi:hypothetical protein LMG27174_06811 [Paraburkholderia rhynchosiae]|uniref:Uncharacterized protein n=2 Tax=Paraburkholderia rhynchosiae TaxID=487049 RepID=A0A6J5CN61_9BURK|nr:hypothetical protein LMG27174_06811 [Paraburkholderia rhynchosiae]